MPVPSLLGASQNIPGFGPPLMQNQNVQAFTQGLGAAFNPPMMDTMGRVINYGAGAPVNMGTAKERGLAGVLGGSIDNMTMGMTDFDKRGDSKKQKDTKKFLKQFVYGTDGMRQENSNTTPGFLDRTAFGTPEGRQAKYDESKKSFLGMPLPEFGVSEKLGLPNFGN